MPEPNLRVVWNAALGRWEVTPPTTTTSTRSSTSSSPREQRRNCANCGQFTSESSGALSVQNRYGETVIYCGVCAPHYVPACPRCNQRCLRSDCQRALIGTPPAGALVCRNCAVSLITCPECHCLVTEVAPLEGMSEENRYCPTCAARVRLTMVRCFACDRLSLSFGVVEQETDRRLCRACLNAARQQRSNTFQLNRFNRSVGFEIEFCAPAKRPAFDMWPEGLIHGDGSVHSDRCDAFGNPLGHGREFASFPANGDQLVQRIRQVCYMLARRQAWVNRTCGLHVHLGLEHDNDRERSHIAQAWRVFETIFFACVDPSRRLNRYCLSVRRRKAMDWNCLRYYAFNRTAHSEHGTYEIRLHHGTLDATELTDWCMILLHTFDAFRNVTAGQCQEIEPLTQRQKLVRFFQITGLPLHLRKSMVRRIRKYNGRSQRIYRAMKYARASWKGVA